MNRPYANGNTCSKGPAVGRKKTLWVSLSVGALLACNGASEAIVASADDAASLDPDSGIRLGPGEHLNRDGDPAPLSYHRMDLSSL